MAYTIYIPDAAFVAGGVFEGQRKIDVVIVVSDIENPTPVQKTGGPKSIQAGPYTWSFGADPDRVIIATNMWNRLSSIIKSQLANLVAKSALIVNDGAVDMTPSQILA